MKIPFNLLPASWGLKGKSYERAKLEYYYEGEDLERKLVDLEFEDETEKQKQHIYLDEKHGKLSKEEFERKLVDLDNEDETENKKQHLYLDKKYDKLSNHEYKKKIATLNKEPWVDIIGDYHPEKNKDGLYIELDWNYYFIEMLKTNGYTGKTESEIIDLWFNELCRNIAYEDNFFDEFIDEENKNNFQQSSSMTNVKRNGTTTEYS